MTQEQTMSEAIRLAIRREQQAHNFLKAVSTCVEQPAIKSLLDELAREELKHREKLELELMKLGEVIPSEQIQSETDNPYRIEADEYIEMDYPGLLQFCVEKEDISFRLYIDLSARTQSQQNREIFVSLAEEELRHKFRFEDMYDTLLKEP